MVHLCPHCNQVFYKKDDDSDEEKFVDLQYVACSETAKVHSPSIILVRTNKGRSFCKTYDHISGQWSEWEKLTMPDLSKQ